MRAVLGAAVLLAGTIGWTSAEAADFQTARASCSIFITGKIEKGDVEKFDETVEFMMTQPGRKCVAPRRLVLNSPGGQPFVAYEIARRAHILAMETVVQHGHECTSACAFVWLGGLIRRAPGKVGFHGFVSASDTSAIAYNKNRSFQDLMATLVEQMRVPPHVVTRIRTSRPDVVDFLGEPEKQDLEYRGDLCLTAGKDYLTCRNEVVETLQHAAPMLYRKFLVLEQLTSDSTKLIRAAD